MAVEVQNKAYNFEPQNVVDWETRMHNAKNKKAKSWYPFGFNYYHDVESVFWIYAWFLHRQPTCATAPEDLSALRCSADDYICSISGNTARTRMISMEQEVEDMVRALYTLYDSPLRWMVSGLEMVDCIRQAYQILEQTLKPEVNDDGEFSHWDNKHFSLELYNELQTILDNVLQKMGNDKDSLPVKVLDLAPHNKRKAEATVPEELEENKGELSEGRRRCRRLRQR